MSRPSNIAARPLALALMLLCMPWLAACIVVPLPPPTAKGSAAARSVGPRGSWFRPIKVGKSTRADVYRRLGPPAKVAEHGREVMYESTVRTGIGLAVFKPFIIFVQSKHGTLLRFDQEDRLVAYEVSPPVPFPPGIGSEGFWASSNPPDFSVIALPGDRPRPLWLMRQEQTARPQWHPPFRYLTDRDSPYYQAPRRYPRPRA